MATITVVLIFILQTQARLTKLKIIIGCSTLTDNVKPKELLLYKSGKTNTRGRLSTADLLIKVSCFVKKVNNIFNIKRS